MKVIGFNGSPRKDGNTTTLIGYLFLEIEKEGIETELVQLSAKAIHGCIACYKCFENQDQRCAVKNDAANEYIEKMTTAQGIILGSPSYFQDVTTEMKALIDRAGFVGLANERMYKNKVGAALSCFRRTGGMHTIETMNHFFFSNEIIIAGRAMSVAEIRERWKKTRKASNSLRPWGKRSPG
jgi:multimeric flavodoxin WrbA